MIRRDKIGDAEVTLNGENICGLEKDNLSQYVSYMNAHEFTLFEKLDAFENIKIYGSLSHKTKLDKMLLICEEFYNKSKPVAKMSPSERSML